MKFTEQSFDETFIKWIQILLKIQESCIINTGTTKKYFKLKSKRQGDPISAYSFILVLEIVFLYIKENKNIKEINIFDNVFLYSAYADDTTFFVSDEDFVMVVMNTLDKFWLLSDLKCNKAKCEIAGISTLKVVSMALSGMGCIELTKKQFKFYVYLLLIVKAFKMKKLFQACPKNRKSIKIIKNEKFDCGRKKIKNYTSFPGH